MLQENLLFRPKSNCTIENGIWSCAFDFASPLSISISISYSSQFVLDLEGNLVCFVARVNDFQSRQEQSRPKADIKHVLRL